MITFGDLKNSGIIDIAGVCEDSDKFMRYVNDATRRLMRRGDWSETAIPTYLCVYTGCVVWPREVGAIRKINICNQSIPVTNEWYQFMPSNLDRNTWMGWRGQECQMSQQGIMSTFKDIQGDGRLVRAYARCNADLGKTVQIFGLDNNNQPLQTNNGDGTFSMGVTITMTSPFGSTSVFVRKIDYVIKQATQCPVDLYAYYAADDKLETLAHYAPSETLPQYARTKLSLGNNGCGSASCIDIKGVLAMVKLRFIPVTSDTDLVLVPNEDALELEIQAIKAQRAGDLVQYKALETAAIQELNQQLRNDVPEDQFAASDDSLGPWVWPNQCF